MKKKTPFTKKLTLGAIVAALIILLIVFIWLINAVKETHIEIGSDDKIDLTPEQIQSIKSIGEWEFLSISDEELVDTTRKGIFSDDHLARIYYGTIRLGINLHQVEPGWVNTQGDSLEITLPKIGLLDRDFIDEARTKSFYESGHWSAEDREALFRRAYRQMKEHCLTEQNIEAAQQNAEAQVRRMFLAMGYSHVAIGFKE